MGTSEFLRSPLFSRHQPGGVFTIVDIGDFPGNIFCVNNAVASATDGAGFGRSFDSPFATLDYAVGFCTANNGDVILVGPGHAENLGADSAVDVDVAGVKIIGLGWGGSKPTFTATAAAGDFKLAATCCWLENVRFVGGIDATTGILEISAADNTLKDIEYMDDTGQATDVIMVLDGSDRLLIDGLKVWGSAAAGGNSAIAIGSSDDVEIKNFYIYGNFAVGAIDLRTAASARINIHDGKIWTANAADIAIVDTITASTGWIGPNLQIMLADNAANITEAVTGATFQLVDPVYVVNLVNEKAMLINWTASTD